MKFLSYKQEFLRTRPIFERYEFWREGTSLSKIELGLKELDGEGNDRLLAGPKVTGLTRGQE
jgi:hypothetical protein